MPSGVNFINVLRANFLYERCLGSLHVTRENAVHTKTRAYNVDEIDTSKHIQATAFRSYIHYET